MRTPVATRPSHLLLLLLLVSVGMFPSPMVPRRGRHPPKNGFIHSQTLRYAANTGARSSSPPEDTIVAAAEEEEYSYSEDTAGYEEDYYGKQYGGPTSPVGRSSPWSLNNE